MTRPSLRTAMVSIRFYGRNIKVLVNQIEKAFEEESNHGKITILSKKVFKQ